MGFKDLIQITRPGENTGKLGCDYCPLNDKKGIHKVLGKVRGRKIFLWAQSPGPQENKERRELIGPSGKFLWYELKKVGITRDMVDIQNVVRCMPADINKHVYPPIKMRAPNKDEIKCCSIYNTQALQKSKAKLHLVFGQVAAKSVLGREYNKTKRIFFSEALKVWVVVLDHPSYFIRQGFQAGSENQPTESLKRFRKDLIHAASLMKNKSYDQFQFLRDQNYIGITTRKGAQEAYRKLKRAYKKGIRIVADMEEGRINKHGKPDDEGETVALCCGFTAKPGTSYTFALQHPDSPASHRCRD